MHVNTIKAYYLILWAQ